MADAFAPIVALLLAITPASHANAAALDAPLGVGTEGPLRALFLDMPAADARLPPSPEMALRWQMANSWTTPTGMARGNELAFVQLDGQSDTLSMAVTMPWSLLSRRLATTLEARATLWSGGWTDAPVETWHKTIGFTNFQRQNFPANEVHLLLSDASGASAFDVRRSRWALGRVTVRNQLLVASGGESLRAPTKGPRERWAVSLRADARLPLGSPARLTGSGGADAGLGVIGTAELARWCVMHANLFTSAWSRLDGGVALQPRRFHHGLEVSAALLKGRWAVIVEDRLLSPIFPGEWKPVGTTKFSDLQASAAFVATRWHNQISVGLRRGMFTAWVSEDFTPGGSPGTKQWFFNSNAPDISIGVEIGRAL